MIDAGDLRATQAFARLLDNGGLLAKIDDALALNNISSDLRSTLSEAKLILAGAENA